MDFNDFIMHTFLVVGMIFFWIVNGSIGFRIVYYLSLFYYFTVLFDSFSSEMTNSFSFLLSPNLLLTSVVILAAILFSHSSNKRTRSSITIALISFCIVSLFFFSIKSVFYSVFFGIFIVYICERMTIWIQQAPDLTKLILAVVFPITLLLLQINIITIQICSFLLGAGVSCLLYYIQIQLQVPDSTKHKIQAVIIGGLGLFLLIGISSVINDRILIAFIHLLLGAWVFYLAPLLFLKFSIYKRRSGHFIS